MPLLAQGVAHLAHDFPKGAGDAAPAQVGLLVSVDDLVLLDLAGHGNAADDFTGSGAPGFFLAYRPISRPTNETTADGGLAARMESNKMFA